MRNLSDSDFEMAIKVVRADIARHDMAAARQMLHWLVSQMNESRPPHVKDQFNEMLREGAEMEDKQTRFNK